MDMQELGSPTHRERERMSSLSCVPRKGCRVYLRLVVSYLALTESVLAGYQAIPKKKSCGHKAYRECSKLVFYCPDRCPRSCSIDCETCKPVCRCEKPGGVCQDPRFVGGDSITFYFHGKKDRDFCLVSDTNLHINAHFIGKRVEGMHRDFTWVQSIALLFDNHQLFVGAKKVARWEDNVDQLALVFDGQPVFLPSIRAAAWGTESAPSITIARTGEANEIEVEIKDSLKISASVVPITEEESRIHRYEITDDDCFAHLDLTFKFFSLSHSVTGVLGQTYAPDFKSPVKIGVPMPILGGDHKFATSGLFAADCTVSSFRGSMAGELAAAKMYESVECGCGVLGRRGIVCKK